MAKGMLLCQGFQFSTDLDIGNVFVESDLCIAILFINCETVVVESYVHFLLVCE